jgi:hypothetical protein
MLGETNGIVHFFERTIENGKNKLQQRQFEP